MLGGVNGLFFAVCRIFFKSTVTRIYILSKPPSSCLGNGPTYICKILLLRAFYIGSRVFVSHQVTELECSLCVKNKPKENHKNKALHDKHKRRKSGINIRRNTLGNQDIRISGGKGYQES